MPYQVVEDVDALITGVSADRNKTAATVKKPSLIQLMGAFCY